MWLRTNPREVERLVTEANKKCDGWLVPLVKLMKASGAPLRGFHLEALSYHALQTAAVSEQHGLAFLFEKLAISVLSTCPDIWPMGENADATVTMEKRITAAPMLASAAAEASRALTAEEEGRIEDAHAIWYGLFGDRYPETGVTPAPAATMSAVEAVKNVIAGKAFSATSAGLIRSAPGFAGVRSATSHGGAAELVEDNPVFVPVVPTDEQGAYLEAAIEEALVQFPALSRIDPAIAANDPALWPMHRGSMRQPYAVMVGEQGTNYGTHHRILVKIPADLPATEPRVYLLRRQAQRAMTGYGRRGVRTSVDRPLKHLWRDGAMCSHSRRDRWDGRLVTTLVYAADWLFRQEHHRRFGRWIGHEIDAGGRHHLRGDHDGGKRRPGHSRKRRRS